MLRKDGRWNVRGAPSVDLGGRALAPVLPARYAAMARPPALSGRAPPGRHRIAAPRDHGALRGQPRPGPELGAGRGPVSPVASLERGEGRKIEQAVVDSAGPEASCSASGASSTTCRGSWTISSRSRSWTAGAPTGWRRDPWAPGSNGTPRSTTRSRTSSSPGGPCRAPTSIRPARCTSPGPGRRTRRCGWSCATRRPAGGLGDAVAQLLGDDPERQVADDLRRFKQVMEAGDVACAPRRDVRLHRRRRRGRPG